MKVILTAQVANLGKIGQVVEVKNGYARNFLIPSSKAICLTKNNEKIFAAKKAEFENQNKELLEVASKIKNDLVAKNIVVIENASDDGRLYGSVTSARIAESINELLGGKKVEKSSVILEKPIKEVGVYSCEVNLHPEVELKAKLVVSRSASEVDLVIKNYEKSLKAAKQEEEKRKEEEKAVKKTEVQENQDSNQEKSEEESK